MREFANGYTSIADLQNSRKGSSLLKKINVTKRLHVLIGSERWIVFGFLPLWMVTSWLTESVFQTALSTYKEKDKE